MRRAFRSNGENFDKYGDDNADQFMSFLRSRLAREVKVVPVHALEAMDWAANSAGLLTWRPRAGGLPNRLAFADLAGKWLAS